MIDNYIKPILGDVKLDEITPRMMAKYYKDLQTVSAVPKYGRASDGFVTPSRKQNVMSGIFGMLKR